MTAIASKAVMKVVQGHMSSFAPEDPHYEEKIDPKTGKKTRVKRGIPDGLSRRDARILKKIRKRAHRLDKGMNLCGFRVGWTFFIGIIPGLGDVVDAGLNYFLIVSPAKKLDIPAGLLSRMLANNAVSAGLGFIPIIGDIGLAAWKANSRNAHLVEAFLAVRGQEYLASLGQGASGFGHADGLHPDEIRQLIGPGSGMEGNDEASSGGFWGRKKAAKQPVAVEAQSAPAPPLPRRK